MFTRRAAQSEEMWMSASDLMTVLMVLFMLIAVFYNVLQGRKASMLTQGANSLIQIEDELCKEIKSKFSHLMDQEKIEVMCSPITITFSHPAYNFASNDYTLTEPFKNVLVQFFPKLIEIIHSKNQYILALDELRIEGHTSTKWGAAAEVKGVEAFRLNMGLSQERAREVLNYCLTLAPIPGNKAKEKWAFNHLTASGLSFSRFKRKKDYKEDEPASRRVEFKLITNTREIIESLRQGMKGYSEPIKGGVR